MADAATPGVTVRSRPARRTPRRTYGLFPTAGGLMFVAAAGVTGAIAMQPSGNVLLLLFGAFVGAILVNLAAGWWSLLRLEITRVLPEAAMAGGASMVRYRVHNPSRFACAYGLRVRDAATNGGTGATTALEGFVPVVRPGRVVTVSVPVVWPARGRYQFTRTTLATRFPFGLCAKHVNITRAEELTVYPSLRGLRTRLWDADRRSEATAVSDGQPGSRRGDEEFFGLREYRHGDNPRRIHWRRSARTGRIFVREMSRPRSRNLWCILNTRLVSPNAREIQRLEEAISGAATMICDVLERGGRIGLVANGQPALASPPGSGRALRGRLLRELAQRHRNPDDSLFARLTQVTWPGRWRGPCMLFAVKVDDDVAASARWLASRVGPVMLLIPGSNPFDGVFVSRTLHVDWRELRPIEESAAATPGAEVAA